MKITESIMKELIAEIEALVHEMLQLPIASAEQNDLIDKLHLKALALKQADKGSAHE